MIFRLSANIINDALKSLQYKLRSGINHCGPLIFFVCPLP